MTKYLRIIGSLVLAIFFLKSSAGQELAPDCDEFEMPNQDELTMEAGKYYYLGELFNGEIKDCYSTGKIWYKGDYYNGAPDGIWLMYREDGTMENMTMFAKGIKHGLSEEYYEQGYLRKRQEYKNGLVHGNSYLYYPSGKLRQEHTFVNDTAHGKSVSYFENGNVIKKGQFHKGFPDGFWQVYNDSIGLSWVEGSYKNGVVKGEWKHYLNGSLWKVETYEQNELIKTTFSNPPPAIAEEIAPPPAKRADTSITVTFGDRSRAKLEAEVFDAPDEEASFPGGQVPMQQFIIQNIIYPQEAIELGEQGKVYVSFVVERDGELTNIEVPKSVSKSLDEEAIRLISLMPNWEPGKHKGKTVRTRCMMPINFVLDTGPVIETKKKKRRRN